MPNFINKSWPILLMPVWWVFWIIGLLLHNCRIVIKNRYRYIKGKKREPKTKKIKTKSEDLVTKEVIQDGN